MSDEAWVTQFDAIDEFAARLHAYDCDGATGSGCQDVHWMAWTGQALAVLRDADVHTDRHAGGRCVVIVLNLDAEGDDDVTTRGGLGGGQS